MSADVIIPKITIYEKEFNFGKITYGNSGVLEMNVENTSPILAKLRLDLRQKDEFKESGIDCLKIKQIRNTDEESFILEGLDREQIFNLEKTSQPNPVDRHAGSNGEEEAEDNPD